jgi:hypothetical protein
MRVSITPLLGTTGRITMPRRQRSPTGGRANFYVNNCGDFGGSSLEIGTLKLTRNAKKPANVLSEGSGRNRKAVFFFRSKLILPGG